MAERIGPYELNTIVTGDGYRLHYGDCIEILRGYPDHSFDAIIIDPPFALAGGFSNGRSSITSTQFFAYWWKDVCEQIDRVIKPEGEGFCWCDWKTAALIAGGFSLGQRYAWRVSQMLYHYREMPGQGQPFRSSVDMIAYLRGPKSAGNRIPNTTHNLISKYWYYGKHPHHPAEKDPELTSRLIEWCSDDGDLILDCFMGGGTTGVASAATGRRFVGIESDNEHFKTAGERIKLAYSGLVTFSDMSGKITVPVQGALL